MRTSQLVLSIILTVMLAGGVSAQPTDQSSSLQQPLYGFTNLNEDLLYDDLCQNPISMSGSPTAYRHVEAGVCIQIKPTFCKPCQNCWCSVTISGGGLSNPVTYWWDCEDGTPRYPSTPDNLCFCFESGGDYTFSVDVCNDEQGVIECEVCTPN